MPPVVFGGWEGGSWEQNKPWFCKILQASSACIGMKNLDLEQSAQPNAPCLPHRRVVRKEVVGVKVLTKTSICLALEVEFFWQGIPLGLEPVKLADGVIHNDLPI